MLLEQIIISGFMNLSKSILELLFSVFFPNQFYRFPFLIMPFITPKTTKNAINAGNINRLGLAGAG